MILNITWRKLSIYMILLVFVLIFFTKAYGLHCVCVSSSQYRCSCGNGGTLSCPSASCSGSTLTWYECDSDTCNSISCSYASHCGGCCVENTLDCSGSWCEGASLKEKYCDPSSESCKEEVAKTCDNSCCSSYCGGDGGYCSGDTCICCDSYDGWYGGGNVEGTDDPACEYRNYYCANGKCRYRVTQTKDCDSNDGWYDTGETRYVCKGDEIWEQKQQEYRDYYCSAGSCEYEVTSYRWVDAKKIDDCNSYDGWYGGGNNPGCGDDPASEYHDYYCKDAKCEHNVTQTKDCDANDICTGICNPSTGNIEKLDYYVKTNSSVCESEWAGVVQTCYDECSDSDEGLNYTTKGTVTDEDRCSGSETSCPVSTYTDYCKDSQTLVEYYCPGNDYAKETKNCNDLNHCDGPGKDEYWDYGCSSGACYVEEKIEEPFGDHNQYICDGSENPKECSSSTHLDVADVKGVKYYCIKDSATGNWYWARCSFAGDNWCDAESKASCVDGVFYSDHCNDNHRNCKEKDVDCGGDCSACILSTLGQTNIEIPLGDERDVSLKIITHLKESRNVSMEVYLTSNKASIIEVVGANKCGTNEYCINNVQGTQEFTVEIRLFGKEQGSDSLKVKVCEKGNGVEVCDNEKTADIQVTYAVQVIPPIETKVASGLNGLAIFLTILMALFYIFTPRKFGSILRIE